MSRRTLARDAIVAAVTAIAAVATTVWLPDARAVAAHAAAPTPYGVFHDLRWLLSYHPSLAWFGLELVAAVLARTTFVATMVHLSWPGGTSATWRTCWRRSLLAVIVTHLLLAPWAGFLFASGVTPLSWIYLAGVLPVPLLAPLVTPALLTGNWRRLPHRSEVGASVLAALVVTVGGAVIALASGWLVVPAVVLAAFANARAWGWLIGRVARADAAAAQRVGSRRLPAVATALGAALSLFMALAAVGLGVVAQSGQPLVQGERGMAPQGQGQPVLVAYGYESAWGGTPTDVLTGAYREVRFSYAGTTDDGVPLTYTEADTHQPLPLLAQRFVAQVRTLRERSGQDVLVVAQSEGALIAQTAATAGLLDGVDRLVLASPLLQPAQVHYPTSGADGWGRAGGALLRAAGRLSAFLAPYEPGADLPFVRSLVEHAPLVRSLNACPPDDVELQVVMPLDTGLTAPPSATGPLPTWVVPSTHAQLLGGGPGGTLQQVVEDGGPQGTTVWRGVARVIHAGSSGWMIPPVPLDLVPAWERETALVRGTGSDAEGDVDCGALRSALRDWLG